MIFFKLEKNEMNKMIQKSLERLHQRYTVNNENENEKTRIDNKKKETNQIDFQRLSRTITA
jgi:hypothetical protein